MLAVCLSARAPGASTVDLFPEPWIAGTTVSEPQIQVQSIGPDTLVIRQSVRTNCEAPFLYLPFGRERALASDASDITANAIGAGSAVARPSFVVASLMRTPAGPSPS